MTLAFTFAALWVVGVWILAVDGCRQIDRYAEEKRRGGR